MSAQSNSGGGGEQKSHLSRKKPDNIPSQLKATKTRERWCQVCRRRVTIGATGEREYGHKVDCTHSRQNRSRPSAEAGRAKYRRGRGR